MARISTNIAGPFSTSKGDVVVIASSSPVGSSTLLSISALCMRTKIVAIRSNSAEILFVAMTHALPRNLQQFINIVMLSLTIHCLCE